MRGLLLLFAVAASAQDPRGFVNQDLATRNVFQDALKRKPAAAGKPKLAIADAWYRKDGATVSLPGPWNGQTCAIPLLEAVIEKFKSNMPILKPDPKTDPKMILPTIPVCGKDTK